MQTPKPSDNWQLGLPYERYVGRWSRRVAPAFLTWLDAGPGRRWLDVGCGTGALCGAIVAQCAPASVTGVEPSAGFLDVARQTLQGQVTFCQGDAAAVPLPDACIDVVVCGLVLNFVPDAGAALREMNRVAVKGATFGAYVWDYADKMQLMRHFWDAAVAVDPAAAAFDEGKRFSLCHPDALLDFVSVAGFHDAAVTAIEIPTLFDSFQDYWEPFLGGQGSAPTYVASLSSAARDALKDRLQAALPARPDGSIALVARAWAVRATT